MWRSFINCIKSVLAECWLPPLNVTSVLWIVEIYTLPSIPSSLFFLLLHRFTFSLPFYIWYLTDVGSTLQITAFLSRLPSRYCVFCKPFLCYSKMSNQLRADQARDSVEQARDSFGSILSYYRHNHESMESVPRWVDSADSSSIIISFSSTVAPSAEQTESYKEHLRELATRSREGLRWLAWPRERFDDSGGKLKQGKRERSRSRLWLLLIRAGLSGTLLLYYTVPCSYYSACVYYSPYCHNCCTLLCCGKLLFNRRIMIRSLRFP